ncbi:integral membrane sensor signal transduction histidine kinase [Novosphingobium nitrogenifigens DSM 19370]|uniref:histidine kinase n=1 Tax=Novosphingobium nitrogenifigens DSM 19370 TaxID=983920 RepID=F1ZDX8_9SPHN|nr:HAMP domain-containing sensor histidine kinase [Novosphingobium nitrogenifigens]EGD57185.1 integral membrane sensor signal transduction histidine kinase [Novosphingobium nitrogenifigens DSM 19370]
MTAIRSAWPGIGRIFIMFGAVFAVAMLAMGAVVFVVAERTVERRIDSALEYHVGKILRPEDGHAATSVEVAARIRNWQSRKIISERAYILYDPAGRLLAGRINLHPPVGFSDVLFRGGGVKWQRGRALAQKLGDGSLLVIVQHSEATARLRALIPNLVVGIFGVAMAFGLGATWLFARMTARRLAATEATADAIAQAGDVSRRVPMAGLDGMFARQAQSLNRMLDRMEDLVQTQRHFASALAHDLRTPLTRLRSLLSADLAQGDGEEAQQRRRLAVEQAERECASIIAIFDALLRLAEIESGRHGGGMVDLPLDDLVGEIAETMEPVIADAGSVLVTGPIEPAAIHGDPGLITQMLVNLLENVATHTPSGTQARLSLRQEADDVVLTLEDNGPGLARDECLRVLRPFERGRLAGGRRGSGLGLSIVQAIVRFHRGHLDLGGTGPGLQVRIAFPARRTGGDPGETLASSENSKFAM